MLASFPESTGHPTTTKKETIEMCKTCEQEMCQSMCKKCASQAGPAVVRPINAQHIRKKRTTHMHEMCQLGRASWPAYAYVGLQNPYKALRNPVFTKAILHFSAKILQNHIKPRGFGGFWATLTCSQKKEFIKPWGIIMVWGARGTFFAQIPLKTL